jgi:GxxExxY protein
VHRSLGPGFLESTYENALCAELSRAGLKFERQVVFPIIYKGAVMGEHRVDLLVEDKVIVELKAVSHFEEVFFAQVLAYLRVTGKRVGLLFNFNVTVLMSEGGFRRFVL